MSSLFSSIPKAAEPLRQGQYWTPMGRAADLPWATPSSPTPTPEPSAAPAGQTVAGGSPRPTWTPPAVAPTNSGGPRLPDSYGLPPIGAGNLDIDASPLERFNSRRDRERVYDAIAVDTIDRLPDEPLFAKGEDSLKSPAYDHPRYNELPSYWSEAKRRKFISFLQRQERGL